MQIEVIRTLDGFMGLKEGWARRLQASGDADFYLSFDWFYAVIFLVRASPENLYIIAIRSGDELIAVLPCTIINRKFRLFGLRSLELLGNIYSPMRGGLAKQGSEGELADALAEFLLNDCGQEWDIVNFEGISTDDPFLSRLIAAFQRKGLASRKADQFVNVITDVSEFDSAEEYFGTLSKSLRQNIRTSVNRMNRKGVFDVALVQNACQDVDRAMDDYYDIYGESWKVSETDPAFHRKLAAYLASQGLLRMFTLYYYEGPSEVRSEESLTGITSHQDLLSPDREVPPEYLPIAADFFVVMGKRAYFLKTAYRGDFARYSAGTVLFWLAIKYLLEVDGVVLIDHQKGDEPYKLRWGQLGETRFLYQAANPRCSKARFELLCDRNFAPILRRLKRLVS